MIRKPWRIYAIAGVLSVILSIWAMLKTSVINPDGICYLYSAEAISQGLTYASNLCEQARWPFYSVLIFGLMKVTHLSSLVSAYLLDGFFSLISDISFIAIVNLVSHSVRILVLSACVILLAHDFNVLRVEIIRDHGFWSFYLLSLYFLLRYFKNFSKDYQIFCYAMLWSISLIIATLFRIEGALFLLLLPLAALLDSRQKFSLRIKMFFQLHALTLICGFALVMWVIIHPSQSLGRLSEIQFQIQHGMNEWLQSFQHIANALASHVLNSFSARDAYWVAAGMLFCWYLFIIFSNLSPIYVLLIIYAWCKKITGFTSEKQLVVWAYIVINILITAIFLVDNQFISKRYLIALSLVLMLWVPFGLDNLIRRRAKGKGLFILTMILIGIYGAASVVDFGHSKNYIRKAGDWLALHSTLQQKIYSNDFQLLYYSNHLGNQIFSVREKFQNLNTIANGQWRQYDYIALRVSQKELKQNIAILQEINLKPVAIFENDRHDQVRIYTTHPAIK